MSSSLVRYRHLVADSARWDGFAFRRDDIVISTPPKCGTTWTQMICALLVFQTPDLPRPLTEISPWLDMLVAPVDEVVAELEAQAHRRFIKSHTPFDGLPDDPRVTYICVGRDPRDVALSMDNHMQNMDLQTFLALREDAVGNADLAELIPSGPPQAGVTEAERFWSWVEADPTAASVSGLANTLHHLRTFWDARDRPNVVMLHYGELKADLEGQMRRLGDRLGIEVPEDRWPVLVEAATFESMRGRAKEMVPNGRVSIWKDEARFFNKGTSGQWRDVVDEAGLARYEARVRQLIPEDLSLWVHGGPIRG